MALPTHAVHAILVAGALLLGSAQSGPGLTVGQKDMLLHLHNKLRGKKNENQPCTATDMEMLTWDDGLATDSQRYADQCVGDHSRDAGAKFGENLWMDIYAISYDAADLEKGVQAWYDEFKDTVWDWGATAVKSKPAGQCTDYDGQNCNVGHYYQVIWAKTKKLGCGVSVCPSLEIDGKDWGNAVYLVCRYDVAAIHKAGSTIGLPYMPGQLCAACADSCVEGLCTAIPSRCVDESNDCAALVESNPDTCELGEEGYDMRQMCAKSCTKCTQPIGIGYDQCDGWSPDLVPKLTNNSPKACKLPAGPLNTEWECKTADGSRHIKPTSIGFFMYSIAYDPDIQCVAVCKPFSRGPMNSGDAIRFTQPPDHIAIAQKCTEPGKVLAYESMSPRELVESDNFLYGFCMSIEECKLPSLQESPKAFYDRESCTMSPAKPVVTAGRYLKEQTCKVKCAAGYELDGRYGKETGKCNFPQLGDGSDQRILGSVGPPTWRGGDYALLPVCIKVATSGWLSEETGDKCMHHAGGYVIPDVYKRGQGCPTGCLENAAIKGWGTEAKQKIVTMCHIMAGYDNKYNPTVKKYCCCAKVGCFDESGALRTSLPEKLLTTIIM